MKWKVVYWIIFSFAINLNVHSQEESTPQVEILAIKNPDRLPAKSFLNALDVREKYRSLAPDAAIGFRLTPIPKSEIKLSTLRLRFISANNETPIEINDLGYFTVDKNVLKNDSDAEFVVSAKSGSTRFRSVVRSQHLQENEKRMGDLRLQCEMNWALLKDDAPLLMRTAFSLAGGLCHSKKIAVSYVEDKQFVSISIEEGERKIALYRGDSTDHYVPPLYDQSWGNDAKLIFEYVSK